MKAHLLQVAVLSNHMNGKDTHIRGIKVFAPKESVWCPPRKLQAIRADSSICRLDLEDDLVPWRSVEFLQHETIR